MTPPVANFVARVQVGVAIGVCPVTLGLAALDLFDWLFAITVMVSAFFLSAIFVPFAGLIISRMGIGKEAK